LIDHSSFPHIVHSNSRIFWVIVLVTILHELLLLVLIALVKSIVILVWLPKASNYNRWIVLWYSTVLDKVLHICVIVSHFCQLVYKRFFHSLEMLISFLARLTVALDGFLARKASLDCGLLVLISLLWKNAISVHEVEELSGDLLKCLFCKETRIVFELGEWYKLDNIT